MTKNNPAMPPTGTHNERALGSFVVGSPHSSAMDVIMPSAQKLSYCQHVAKSLIFYCFQDERDTHVYADGSMPMKNEKPPHPESDVS